MRMRRWLLASMLLLPAATDVAAQDAPKIEALSSPVTVRLRGLSAVDANIAWASGREGTVLRTVDAGKTWSILKVPGAEKLDFRDVKGFSADEAAILSIGPGEDSRVYRTSDAGRSWQLALQNRDPKAFFDCFDFDGNEGRLLGDPVDGRFQLLGTTDGGKSWSELRGPEALEGEAAFAASGTCVLFQLSYELVDAKAVDTRATVIVSGGSAPRAHWQRTVAGVAFEWQASPAGSQTKSPSSGFFSVASSRGNVIAVGGDFQHEGESGAALGLNMMGVGVDAVRAMPRRFSRHENEKAPVLQSIDTLTYLASTALPAPSGYRSGLACNDQRALCIATGPSGSDAWDGKQWSMVEGAGYDSVDVAGDVFWFSGDGGRLGRLVLPAQ